MCDRPSKIDFRSNEFSFHSKDCIHNSLLTGSGAKGGWEK